MQYKVYNLKGINVRSSDLNRDFQEASDSLNILRNKRGDIEDREGSEQVATGFGQNGLFRYDDGNELISIDAELKKLVGGSWSEIDNSADLTLSTNSDFSSENIEKSLYFVSEDEKLLKYDGGGYYRAGMTPAYKEAITALTPNSSAGTTKEFSYAIQYFTIDRNDYSVEGNQSLETTITAISEFGNGEFVTVDFVGPIRNFDNITVANGRWEQNHVYAPGNKIIAPDNNIYICKAFSGHTSSDTATEAEDFQIDLKQNVYWELLLKDCTGFQNKFAEVDGPQTNVTSVQVIAGHNLITGDVIYVEPNQTFLALQSEAIARGASVPEWNYFRKVTQVSPTSIAFDGDAYGVDFPDGYILTNTLALIYQKNITDGGELLLQKRVPIDPRKVSQSADVYVDNDAIGTYPTYAQVIGLPPSGRDMAFHQEQIFIITDDHSIDYSDTLNYEIFPQGDNQIRKGKRKEGKMVAIESIDDYLFIFKEREIYFGSGSFGTNAGISIYSAGADGNGCAGKGSIQIIDKMVHYLSSDGFFRIAGGGRPEEISERINQLISEKRMPDYTPVDFELSKAKSWHDDKGNKYICYIPATTIGDSVTFVYDYYYKDWYLWKGIRADGGVAIVDDIFYYQGKNGTLVKQNPNIILKDSGISFKAFYSTHWHNGEEAGIDKKFIRTKVYSIDPRSNEFKVTSQLNWIDIDEYTKKLSFSGGKGKKSENVGIDKNKGQALRLRFDSIPGKKMIITGYEINIDPAFKKMKK